MIKEKLKSNYIYPLILFVILITLIQIPFMLSSTDSLFLYNRIEQIYNCLCDGNMPWFYYDDLGGLGYGSSFFYGQLTILPFVVLVPFGSTFCIAVYVCVAVLVAVWGAKTFFIRFSENYNLLCIVFIGSPLIVNLIFMYRFYVILLSVGLMLAFFAYSVDYFRDGKNYFNALFLFFLLLNTNKTEAYVASIGVILICIYYFNFKRVRGYIEFLFATIIACSYTLLNILYHSGILTRVAEIAQEHIYSKAYVGRLAYAIFGTRLTSMMFGWNIDLSSVLSVTALLIILYNIRNIRFTLKKVILLLIVALGIAIGTLDLWLNVNSVIDLGLQFPIRYTPLLLAIILAIFLPNKLNKLCSIILMFVSLFTILITPVILTHIANDSTEYGNSIILGEFLDSSFSVEIDDLYLLTDDDLHLDVTDSYGNVLDFTEDAGVITVLLDGSEGSVLFPKLYYKGYICKSDDTTFEVMMGYSQYIEVDFDGYVGEVTLEYVHPLWLRVLFLFSIFFIGLLYVKRRD